MTSPSFAAGLSAEEAARRLALHGPNELGRARPRGLWPVLRTILREPMFLLLLGAAALYLVLGDLGQGLFLTGGACVAISLVLFQEVRNERALKALRELAEPYVQAVRDGTERPIPVRELVPGDHILVGEGQRVPADAVLRRGDLLRVDESTLTGESAPTTKTPLAGEVAETESYSPGGDGGPLLFAGTLIVGGHGAAEVVRTGAGSALGRIGASLAGIVEEPTPLQRTVRRLVAFLGLLALVFCGLIVLAYGLLRGSWIDGALAGITTAVALIPEEAPMVLAIFLALGSWRLARHKVLVRRPAVIEALGGASLLCVDKTGTLTEGRMKVSALWTDGAVQDPNAAAALLPEAQALLDAAMLASPPGSIDPMDRAIAAAMGHAAAMPGEAPERSWPLQPKRPAVVQVWADGAGETAAAKGAPETIFHLCRLPPDRVAALERAVDGLAAVGLRVLAVADCRCDLAFPAEPEEAAFAFRGLIGFLDPVKAEVPEALAQARRAGVAVAMITGDYPATALAIARQAGIDTAPGVLTGPELRAVATGALAERIRAVRVFARIQPEQKLMLVEAFKADGEIVAMTGDGVNDAPALEAAHIGIAMGRRGSDVARESADLVLMEDSFAAIIGGVRLGRRIFINLRKALTYVTAIHLPIAGLALTPILLGLPPLLLPMHVVLLELAIDPVCSLVFESEPSEIGAMQRPPRRPDEALFGPAQLALALLEGLAIFGAVLGLYVWALDGGSEREARGAAFACLILSNLFLANPALGSHGVRLFDRRRSAFWIISLAAVAVLAAILSTPWLGAIFAVAPPRPALLLASVVIAALAGSWRGLGRLALRLGR